MSGPLDGLKVVELAGMGPAPYACMLLADAGADVIRLDRPSPGAAAAEPARPAEPAAGSGDADDGATATHWDLLNRGRPTVGVDLKRPEAVELVLDLVAGADVLVEGFRPGVVERLGLGPEDCWRRNPRLVVGRMTGWGQEGPLAEVAGHDVDYIALAGALWAIGRSEERPTPPLNLVGDFGGGGMLLAFGVMAAVFEAGRSGKGQVVDAAMIDGAASLMTMTYAFAHLGVWRRERGANLLDTGAHFYEVYETSDGGWFAVGAIEPKFYAELLRGLGLDSEDLPPQLDRERWPEMKERFAAVFRTKTRDEWQAVFEGTDACAAPVLSPWEAPVHPHHVARGTFTEVGGVVQPAPAPRFSRTPSQVGIAPVPGAGADAALASWGVDPAAIASLRSSGAIG